MGLNVLGCKKIYATDLEGILENTKLNIDMNFTQMDENNNITVQPLEWGNKEDMSQIKEKKLKKSCL